MQKADFFRNDTWVCLDSKYQNPQKSPWRHFFKFELNLAAILDFDVFEKIVKHSIFGTKASVTPLDICFWGQRIHFWHQNWDLTNFTRNRGQKWRFKGQKWITTLLPVNDRNIHAMSLEIFFCVKKMIFFTYVVTFSPIYARWGPKISIFEVKKGQKR